MNVPRASPATLSSSAIALQLLTARRSQDHGAQGELRAAQPGTAVQVAERLTYEEKLDNLFRMSAQNALKWAADSLHMTYATPAKLGLAMERQGEAMAQATPQSLDMFAPEDAVRIANFGADAAIEVPAIRLDKVAFDDLVGTWAKDNLKDQPGFAAALADGTLMIRQASEVPEFNYVEKSFAFFKDGNMIGGGGWGGPFNQTLYDQVAATGVQQAFGSVMGQGFYMTWPGHAR